MSSKGATVNLELNDNRNDTLLFSEEDQELYFHLTKQELKFLDFVDFNMKKFDQNVYFKKIGFVSKENLNISIEDEEICNLRVDELAKNLIIVFLVALINEEIYNSLKFLEVKSCAERWNCFF